MVPRPSICSACCEESASLKCCSACKKAWYCTKECQRVHWRRHIFECKLKGPIGTAYYLSRACYADTFPIHAQTRKDFGFDKAERLLGPDGQTKLFGLWIGVFKFHQVAERKVQKWQEEGTMVQGIRETFERPSQFTRGAYYPWFLDHQYLLDGSPFDGEQANERLVRTVADAIRQTWVKAGGSPDDSVETIQANVAALPLHIQDCHRLYRSLSLGYPPPHEDLWRTFGFVAAMDQGGEMSIARQYKALIGRCTFAEFCAAHEASSIVRLASTYGVNMPSNYTLPLEDSFAAGFQDIMAKSPNQFKSVWSLKQYVDMLLCSDASQPPPFPHPAIDADYGFMNCRNTSEKSLLEDLYKKYFAHRDARPLELHRACIAGELFQYLGSFVGLRPKTATYKRLLENVYPSPMLGEWQDDE
ncbi:hypothetical protein C2E23DRAFT_815931 [Lenzites betulinus]|nr:hypothetical protein C2E23DRAFT_815931 [Lenzites betulinus]